MSRSMSRSSAQTSSRDFREIDRRIEEKRKAVFKYNSSCTDFKIFELTHIADVFVVFWQRVWIVKLLLLLFCFVFLWIDISGCKVLYKSLLLREYN